MKKRVDYPFFGKQDDSFKMTVFISDDKYYLELYANIDDTVGMIKRKVWDDFNKIKCPYIQKSFNEQELALIDPNSKEVLADPTATLKQYKICKYDKPPYDDIWIRADIDPISAKKINEEAMQKKGEIEEKAGAVNLSSI